MKRIYAVIGLGRFGSAVAETLAAGGRQVIAIDRNEKAVQALADRVSHAVAADATDERVLRSLDMSSVDVAVVSIGESIEASVLAVMLLKELGVRQIVAKAVTALHGKVLGNLGAGKIVYPERDMAVRIAQALMSPNILEYLEISATYGIMEVAAPQKYIGLSLARAEIRSSFGVTVIGIRHSPEAENSQAEGGEEEQILISPHPDYVMRRGDVLVVIGSQENLSRFSSKI